MSQITLSKSNYLKESRKLDNYQRFLPSLDLKRQQLMVEKSKAKKRLDQLDRELAECLSRSAQDLPMLANTELNLSGLVEMIQADITEVNVLGVLLPKVGTIEFAEQPQSVLTRPHWVDSLIVQLQRAAQLQVELTVQQTCFDRLVIAARKATQRVNLVSKVLIPQAQANMRKIAIFLSDNERAAVVRSKLAKQKKQTQTIEGLDQ